jgi:hypothetical protein
MGLIFGGELAGFVLLMGVTETVAFMVVLGGQGKILLLLPL